MLTRLQAALAPAAALIGATLACAPLAAQQAAPSAATAAPTAAAISAPTSAASLFGSDGRTLDAARLDQQRGGASTQVFNDMELDGVVADNRAVDVVTGTNTISSGALSGASGLPLIVQNSGNNVLIQNATIVNVQLK